MAALMRYEFRIYIKRTVPLCRRLSSISQKRKCMIQQNNKCKVKREHFPNIAFCVSSFGILQHPGLTQNVRLVSKSTTSIFESVDPNRDKKKEENQEHVESEEDKEKKMKRMKWLKRFGAFVFTTSIFTTVYAMGSPPLDPENNVIEDEFSHLNIIEQYLRRAYKRGRQMEKEIIEPSREKLLPEPLQYPYIQPPYTLVLEMTGVLVHPCWSYNTGWRFKKRPGLDYFLKAIGPPMFETVIFTKESGMNADPLLNNLDPEGHIMYRLYRDATRYTQNAHVKDLSCLNRDLSRVIFIDWDKEAYQLQKSNAFRLKKYNGEDDDRYLVDLAHFLQAIAASKVEDVRPVLDYYSQFEEPLEKFKENQAKLQEEQEKMAAQMKQQQKSPGLGGFSTGFFRRS